ncbi:hypothetical protein [Streptomyces sp. NPDC006477]|uniref:hypothetical protein n=1 Tax=Streptomyces sp. NPDC006477 TaxID=3364747 RepID=UPI0036AB7835
MSVSASRLLALVRDIAASDPHTRESAADQVTDLVSGCSLADGRVLAGLLAAAAECETDPAALEAQLNAIIQLGPLAEPDMVARLRALDVEKLPPGLGDYVEDILEDAEEGRGRGFGSGALPRSRQVQRTASGWTAPVTGRSSTADELSRPRRHGH